MKKLNVAAWLFKTKIQIQGLLTERNGIKLSLRRRPVSKIKYILIGLGGFKQQSR